MKQKTALQLHIEDLEEVKKTIEFLKINFDTYRSNLNFGRDKSSDERVASALETLNKLIQK